MTEGVGDTRDERALRADDDQVGAERARQLTQPLAVLGSHWVARREAGDPRVPRRRVELRERRRG